MKWTEPIRLRWKVFGTRPLLLGLVKTGLCWALVWGVLFAVVVIVGHRVYSWHHALGMLLASFMIGVIIEGIRILCCRTVYLGQGYLSVGRSLRERRHFALADCAVEVVEVDGHDVLQIACLKCIIQLAIPDPHGAAAAIRERQFA